MVAADAQPAHSTEPSFEVREALIEIREMWGAAQRLRDSTSKPEFMFRMGEIMGRLVMDGEITSTQAAAVGNWINEQESWTAAVLTILETEENNE